MKTLRKLVGEKRKVQSKRSWVWWIAKTSGAFQQQNRNRHNRVGRVFSRSILLGLPGAPVWIQARERCTDQSISGLHLLSRRRDSFAGKVLARFIANSWRDFEIACKPPTPLPDRFDWPSCYGSSRRLRARFTADSYRCFVRQRN